MADDQYSAFDEGSNDPYASVRKILSSGARPGQAPGSPEAPPAPGGSYGSMPTPANYSAASTSSTGFPGGGPPPAPQGQSRNPWGNTSAIQGMLGGNAANAGSAVNALVNQNEPLLSFLGGSPTDSPLYKSLLNNARSSISNSYDSAVANTRSNAESRGFGYEQPIEQGAEEGVRSQEAGALSAAPSAALEETIAPELQAAQIGTQEAGLYNQQDIANLGDITSLQQARLGKTSSMFNSIMQLIESMVSGGASAGAASLSHP